MFYLKQRIIYLIIIFGFVSSNIVAEEYLKPVTVIEVQDLYQEGYTAAEKRLPILIMFSMQHCPYCELIREDFLKPMLRSGDYENKVIIREIHSDSYATLRDFDGKEVSVDELAHRYRASLSPTVVFLDHTGRELSKRMIGVTTVDYYGGYLDEAIEQSFTRMQSNFRQASK